MTALDYKLKTSTFKYIESEVYNLQNTLEEIELLKENIMHPFDEEPDDPAVVAGSNSVRSISNPTEQTATLLLEHKTLKRMEQKANAIIGVYNRLIDEKKEVIKLYYWDKPGQLTWDGVAHETSTSRRTAIRWRKKFIQDIADVLGET